MQIYPRLPALFCFMTRAWQEKKGWYCLLHELTFRAKKRPEKVSGLQLNQFATTSGGSSKRFAFVTRERKNAFCHPSLKNVTKVFPTVHGRMSLCSFFLLESYDVSDPKRDDRLNVHGAREYSISANYQVQLQHCSGSRRNGEEIKNILQLPEMFEVLET